MKIDGVFLQTGASDSVARVFDDLLARHTGAPKVRIWLIYTQDPAEAEEMRRHPLNVSAGKKIRFFERYRRRYARGRLAR